MTTTTTTRRKTSKALFKCMQCGRKFRTTKSAERAMMRGCPKCGASDVDLA